MFEDTAGGARHFSVSQHAKTLQELCRRVASGELQFHMFVVDATLGHLQLFF